MSECIYDKLPIGTSGICRGADIHCGTCGHQFAGGFRITYRGHMTEGVDEVVHVFTVGSPFHCPQCGTRMVEFTSPCAAGGEWVVEDFDAAAESWTPVQVDRGEYDRRRIT